jgi:transposase InsO family protein
MELRVLIRAKKRSRHVPGISDAHVPNVLKRDFSAAAPNQKWATDVTRKGNCFDNAVLRASSAP